MLDHVHKEAGSEVVIEEFLDGQEISIHAFCDGKLLSCFRPHKIMPIHDGDEGKHLGRGTIAPISWVSADTLKIVVNSCSPNT